MGFGQCLSPPRGVRSVSINDGWGNGLLEMDLHLGSLFVIWPTGCVILYDLGLLFLWMSSSLPELSENFVVKLSPNLQNKLKIFPLLREVQIIFRLGSGSGKSHSGGRARKRHLPLAFICLKMHEIMQLCKLWNIIFVALFSCRSVGTDAKPWYRRKNHSRTSPRTSLRGYLCRCRRRGNPQVDIKILKHVIDFLCSLGEFTENNRIWLKVTHSSYQLNWWESLTGKFEFINWVKSAIVIPTVRSTQYGSSLCFWPLPLLSVVYLEIGCPQANSHREWCTRGIFLSFP